ncbi:prepilin peptidase [Helicobacter ibis]|uniref:Prepilin peptidase n=1 Tax=Helicobacter ibis TaxID=2962633 RepID=A0ABT4VFN8_9HELI|nr:A24 family peptidase [Helicobacter ibis]MDA3968958.1 prepilin peptidase [Helicobacter ibis]
MYILIFLLGISFGSFLNLLIYRIPKNLSIIIPNSYCNNCKTPLKLLAKIPLISYFTHNRCACGYKVPFYYFIHELLAGILCVMLYYFFGVFGLLYFLLFLFFYCLAFIDYILLEIPSVLNFLVFFLAIATQYQSLYDCIINSLLFMGFISFLKIFLESILKKEVLGEGDIIIFGTIGASFDTLHAMICIFISALYALLFMIFYKKQIIPFVPFLFLGFFSVFFVKYAFQINLGFLF